MVVVFRRAARLFNASEDGAWFSRPEDDPSGLLRLKETTTVRNRRRSLATTNCHPGHSSRRRLPRRRADTRPRRHARGSAHGPPEMMAALSAWHASHSQVLIVVETEHDLRQQRWRDGQHTVRSVRVLSRRPERQGSGSPAVRRAMQPANREGGIRLPHFTSGHALGPLAWPAKSEEATGYSGGGVDLE